MRKLFTCLIALVLFSSMSWAAGYSHIVSWDDFNSNGYTKVANFTNYQVWQYQWKAVLQLKMCCASYKSTTPYKYTIDGTEYMMPTKGSYPIQGTCKDLMVCGYDCSIDKTKKYSLFEIDGAIYAMRSGTVTVEEGADGPYIYCNAVTITNGSSNYSKYNNGSLTFKVGTAATYYNVTVNSNNSTMGTASYAYKSGYVYADNRTTEFKKNSVYTITATANPGYIFTQWSDGNTDATRDITITGNATYTAQFIAAAAEATITLKAGTGGSVSGAGTFDTNTQRTITATPNANYGFARWEDTNNHSLISTSASYQFTLMTDVNYTAVFYAPGTITAAVDPTEDGTVTGGGSYNGGSQVTLTAEPAKCGMIFSGWTDGNNDNPRTVTVDGDKTYTAKFARLTNIHLPASQCVDATSQSPAWIQFIGESADWRALMAINTSTFAGTYTTADFALANCKIINKAKNETIMVASVKSAQTWGEYSIRYLDATVIGDNGKTYHVVMDAPNATGVDYDNAPDGDVSFSSCTIDASTSDKYDGSMSFSDANTRYIHANTTISGYTYHAQIEVYGANNNIATGVYPIQNKAAVGSVYPQHGYNDYYGIPTLIGGTALTKHTSSWDDDYFWMIRAGEVAVINNSGTYFVEMNGITSNGKKIHYTIGTRPNISVTVNGDNGGTVTLNGTATTTGSFAYDAKISLTPSPADKFQCWEGADADKVFEIGGVYYVRVGVTGLDLTAHFEDAPAHTVTLTCNPVDGGTAKLYSDQACQTEILPTSGTTYSVEDGTTVYAKAVPAVVGNTYYQFTGWTGIGTDDPEYDAPNRRKATMDGPTDGAEAGDNTDNPIEITVTADMEITANFAAYKKLTITTKKYTYADPTLVAADCGTFTFDPEGIKVDKENAWLFPAGTAVTITAEPATGYEFNHWVVGDDEPGDNPLPELSVDEISEITAVFYEIPQPQDWTILDNENDAYYNTIAALDYEGGYNVTLSREFTADQWSTVCLPFDVDYATMFSSGMYGHIYAFSSATGDASKGMDMNFTKSSTMEAGVPYLYWENKSRPTTHVANPVFAARHIMNPYEAKTAGDASSAIKMKGTLRKGTLQSEEDGCKVMGLSKNKVYYATSGMNMRAFRAYFLLAPGTPAPARIHIVAEGETVTELETVMEETTETMQTKKYMENGILVIERNGIKYNTQGAVIK